MDSYITIQFSPCRGGGFRELELPLDIPAEELIRGLNEAYRLGMDSSAPQEFHLQAENPIALLRGSRTLREFGLHDGSRIYCLSEGPGNKPAAGAVIR